MWALLYYGCGHVQLDPCTRLRVRTGGTRTRAHTRTRADVRRCTVYIRPRAPAAYVRTRTRTYVRTCTCMRMRSTGTARTRVRRGYGIRVGWGAGGARAPVWLAGPGRAYQHHVRIRACAFLFCASSIGLGLLSSFELRNFRLACYLLFVCHSFLHALCM